MRSLVRALRLQPVHLIIAMVIVGIFLAGSLVSERFMTLANATNVQEQLVALALLALAQTVVILSGGIDLSYAGFLSLLTVVFAGFAGESTGSLLPALVVVIAMGLAIGALHGVLVALTGIHPLIITLGTSTIMTGAALLWTRQPAGSVPLFFEDLAYARFAGIPFGTYVVVIGYVAVAFILWRTLFGMRVYAIGADASAARMSGVPVMRTLIAVYTLSGFLVSLAAIYMVMRSGVGDPRAGVGFDLRSITPVVVGGTLLVGGRGGVVGTALAVVMLAYLANLFNFMNISSFYQWIVEGIVIIIAVSLFSRKAATRA